MLSDSRQFREQLLARSLQYAVDNVPFYRNLAYLREKGSSLALQDFPFVTKHQLAANVWQFLALNRFPDYLISSSGTSEGLPSFTFRNQEEYEAAHHYVTGMNPSQAPDLDSIIEFALDIFFNTNGYSWRKVPGWPMLSIRLEQTAHAQIVRSLIQEGMAIGGRRIPARSIQAQNGPLRALTGYFLVTGFRPRECGITSVYAYGSHVSQVWRARLADLWGGELLTSYGLSEFAVLGARECPHCGSYHFWTAWPEFLTPDLSHPVEQGDATLVLTSLVPFTHVQPRIRYLTQDFVTVTGHCDAADQIGFRFRGRAASSVVARDGPEVRVVLSEIEVTEVLDQLPDIHCHPHYCEQVLWSEPGLSRPPFRMGVPRFRIAPAVLGLGPAQVKIEVETAFDPMTDATRASKLRELFLEALFTGYPHLPDRLAALEATLVIELWPPDALSLRTKASA